MKDESSQNLVLVRYLTDTPWGHMTARQNDSTLKGLQMPQNVL